MNDKEAITRLTEAIEQFRESIRAILVCLEVLGVMSAPTLYLTKKDEEWLREIDSAFEKIIK